MDSDSPTQKGNLTLKYGLDLLAAQWLRLHTSTAAGMDSIAGQGTKIPHAVWCGQKKKETYGLSEQMSISETLYDYLAIFH